MAYLENGKVYSGRIFIQPESGGLINIIRLAMVKSGWVESSLFGQWGWGKTDAQNAWFKNLRWTGPTGENQLKYSFNALGAVENFFVSDLWDEEGNVLLAGGKDPNYSPNRQFEMTNSNAAGMQRREVDGVDFNVVRTIETDQAEAVEPVVQSQESSLLWWGLGALGIGAAALLMFRR
jgi:hypothetical protein